MSAELLSVLPGLLIGLVLGVGWHWARDRRERRSQDAALLLDRLSRMERARPGDGPARGAAAARGEAGEWWRPAVELAAGLHDAAAVCGDPRLADLPDPVPVEEGDPRRRPLAGGADAEVLRRRPRRPRGSCWCSARRGR